MDAPIYNPPLPYVGPLRSGLSNGSLVKIQGTTLSHSTCFAINLQCGPSFNYGDDIALHLSPVFSPPPRVVRNSFENQRWGPEESHGPGFPFVAGQGFEIMILTESDHFKIAINGQHYTEFHHRIPVHRISHITVNGDVTISMINFEGTSIGRSVSPSPGGFAGGFMAPPPSQPSYSPTPGAPPPYPTSPMSASYGGVPGGPPPYPSQPSPYPPPPNYGGQFPSPHAAGYPSPHSAGYPSQPYGQSGPYPGSTVYPHSPTSQPKSGSSMLPAGLSAGLAAGAASLGAAMLTKGHNKHGKHKKHSSMIPGGLAAGAAALTGAGLMGHGRTAQHHQQTHGKHGSSSLLPAGMAVGAAALTGAALMGRGPLGKVMKPKKMKKLYKHKGWGSSSSSSSSSEEE